MALDNRFFEKTRLDIIKAPVCMADKSGKLLYMNPPCGFMCSRGKLAGMKDYGAGSSYFVLGASGGERIDLVVGAQKRNFDALGARILDAETVAYVDSRFATPIFPVSIAGYLNIALDVYSGKLLIPVFGGEVHKLPGAYDGERKVYETGRKISGTGSSSGMSVENFFAENFVRDEVEYYRRSLAAHGYRIAFNSENADLVICRESVYDLSVVFGLLMISALKYADDKTMLVNLRKSETAVGISISFGNKALKGEKRVSAEEYFANDVDEKRVISGLARMCELYSWSLVCAQSESRGQAELSLNLPIYGKSPRKFREETDRTHAEELIEALKFLDGEMAVLKIK